MELDSSEAAGNYSSVASRRLLAASESFLEAPLVPEQQPALAVSVPVVGRGLLQTCMNLVFCVLLYRPDRTFVQVRQARAPWTVTATAEMSSP
jgi:hypothetical protein